MEDLESSKEQISTGWKELEDKRELIQLKEVCVLAEMAYSKSSIDSQIVCVVCAITRLRKPSSSVYLTRF